MWIEADSEDPDWQVRFAPVQSQIPGQRVFALFGEPIHDEQDPGYYYEPPCQGFFHDWQEANEKKLKIDAEGGGQSADLRIHLFRVTFPTDEDRGVSWANRRAQLLIPSLEIDVVRSSNEWPEEEIPSAVSMLYVGAISTAVEEATRGVAKAYDFLRVHGPETPDIESEFDARLRDFQDRLKEWRKTAL